MTRERTTSPIEPTAFEPLAAGGPAGSARRHPVRWLLGGTLLLFALAMGFLFSSRSLQVTVQAEGEAAVSLAGLAIPFGDRYLLRPGTYRVSVTAEGYYPLETTVVVDQRDSQVLELTLQPLPGLLTIDSVPEVAVVTIDGETVGHTPLEALPVAAGNHHLGLQAERYLSLEQDLQVTGRNIEQRLDLVMDPAWAEVAIDSSPTGATILVDGEVSGTTPASLEVLQGERQVILQLPTYATWEETLMIEAGIPVDLGRITLQPAAGLLELTSVPSGANVTLDGEFQGRTPVTLELTPGRQHRLAVFKPGFRHYADAVELPAGGTDQRTITLKAQLGEVRFEISPVNAELRINGRPVGRGSQTVSLPAVEHSVEVALEGHATVRKRVTPRPGLEQLVRVTLQTEKEAQMARLKPEVTTALGQTLLLLNPADPGSGSSTPGDFTMGASRREPGRRANEVLHPVSLRRMFYLQTTEVTNAQFRLYQKNHNSGQVEGNSLNRDHQPVVQVSWQQAAGFCNWLSEREGLPPFYRQTNGIVTGFNPDATGYRLPTEAEWAWAARVNGDNLLKFPWEGNVFPPTHPVENYADKSSAFITGRTLSNYDDGHPASAAVASFGPNHHGLFDMGGNVAEWVHDVYTIPAGSGVTEVDPLGPQTGDNFVIRGASWAHSKIAQLRLSYRDYGQAGRDDVGFRIARYAE